MSIINLKGGVGKSMLTMILGEILAFRFGKDVLLIDMDAQANLSYCMVPAHQIKQQDQAERTTYHLFKKALDGQIVNDIRNFLTQPPLVVSNIARGTMTRYGTRLDMVVSTPSVAELDQYLLDLWKNDRPVPKDIERVLASALAPVQDIYDYVLIDCPPGLSLFSSAALFASDYFVCPVIPEPLSLQGVDLVQKRAMGLKEEGAKAEFRGIIFNIVKHYRTTHQRIAEQVYTSARSLYQPFDYWVSDNERLRALGEFDPEVRGPGVWAGGVKEKFATLLGKYDPGYSLTNPSTGSLDRRTTEDPKYRLYERLIRLCEEFQRRCS